MRAAAGLGTLPFAYRHSEGRRNLAYLGVAVLAVMAPAALFTGVNAFYGHIAEVVRQQAR